MKEVIDVESYEIDTQSIIHDNIDVVLHSNGLFRLDAFSYTVGDCLFDTFQVLLHFRYSSTELRNGLIDYFLSCFKNGDVEALESYEYELESDFLRQLHGIHDVATYFSKMRLSASPVLPAHERGLWGDTFCIRWLSNWLNISVGIWSLTRKTRYLLFNKTASDNPYCILFHDANVVSGHYEPLLYRKMSICNVEGPHIYLSVICKDLESQWKRILHRIDCHGLQLATNVVSSCGDSLFNAICCLVAVEFDVQSLWLYTVQSFCNAIIGGNQQAFRCLHQHLCPYLLENMSAVGSWQEYLVNMALPYEKGNVEGCRFCLQWLSMIFRVNIQVWSALPDGTVHSWFTDSNYDRTIDILSLKTDTTHIHYEPLLGHIGGSGLNVHATQTTSNLHTRGMLFSENETPPGCDMAIQGLNKKTMREIHHSCDEAIQGLNKKCRVSYHNLKKVMRQIRPSCDEAIQALNKKRRLVYENLSQSEIHPSCHQLIVPLGKKRRVSYHNLKKVMRERKKYIATLPFREKLTYHNLKKFVRAEHNRNRYGRISQNGHATVTFRGLEATPCSTTNENQETVSTHTSLRKKNARQTYMKQIKDTPSIACAICEQLNFSKNTKSFTPDLQAEYLRLTVHEKPFSSGKVCLPCKRSLENGKLPQFATPDQIRCNTPLPDVSALTELEERLVSLRIAFAQIRPWGYKRPQMGLTGSIINVPVQLDVVQKALPQFISNTMTIVVALKRRLRYKNAYQTGKVCVHVVMKALKELCSRALYKAQNICINGNWNNVLAEEDGNSADTLENPSEFDTSDESENETPAEDIGAWIH
jgi:hypothetical protein